MSRRLARRTSSKMKLYKSVIESLEERRLLSFGPNFPFDNALRNNVGGLTTGVQQFLENTHKMIFDQSFATKLPIVGDALKSMKNGSNDYIRLAINELGKFNTDLSSLTAAQSAQAFQTALDGLSFLNLYAPGLTVSDGGSTSNLADGESSKVTSWKINLRIQGEALGPNAKLPFNLGLPALDLKLNGQLKASLKYDFNMPLVIDTTGVWFETSGDQEFKMTLAITAPNTTFGGSLGFLKVTATDAGSALTGNLKIDLQDRPTDNDTKLYVSEIPAALPKILKKVELTGDAKAYFNIALDTSLPGLPQQFNDISNAPTMPRVTTEFRLDWSLPSIDIKAGELNTSNIGASPVVRLNNISLDLGTTANKVIIPLVQRVNTLLTPARNFFDLFDQPVELFDVVAPTSLKTSWGNSVTPDAKISMIEAIKGITETIFTDPQSQPRKDLNTLLLIRSVIRSVESASNTFNPTQNSFAFNFGSFQFGQTVDVRTLLPEALRDPGNPLTNYGTPTLNTADLPATFASLKSTLSSGNFGGGQGEAGFKFPIVDQPLSVFGLLLGRPVDLVTFTTPKLSKEFTFDVEWPIPVLPVVKLKLLGGIAFDTQFRFGFDTWGVQSWGNANFQANEVWRLLDGFYVADTNAAGVDVPEVEVRAEVKAGVALGVPGLSIGVAGGIRGIFGIDLDDPNNDGKLRPSEIVQVASVNPLCLFRLTGEIKASASVFGNLGPVPINFPIAEATLAKFTLACPPPPPPVPLADLVADNFVLSAVNPGPASTLRNYSINVRNEGAGNAGASSGRIVISDDDVFDASDITLINNISVPALAAGESTTLNGSLNLPRYAFATDNQTYIGFIADTNGQVNEENEGNNASPDGVNYIIEGSHPIGTPGPIAPALLNSIDLTNGNEVSAWLSDELIGSRDLDVYRVSLNANGQPVGIDINSSFNVDTYLRIYDANWNLIAQNDDGTAPSDNPNFTPQPNKSAYAQFIPPATGTYYVVVSGAWNLSDARRLDGRSQVPGGNESLDRPYRIRYLPNPFALPDLRVRSLSATGNFNFITAVVANEGQAPADWTDVRFFLSDDSVIDPGDILLATGNTINFSDPNLRLNPGQTVTINIDLTTTGGFLANADPFLTDNEYFLGTLVDSSSIINESSETNNANQGLGIDQLLVRTEVDLGTIGSGVVVARPLTVGGLPQTGTLGDELIRRRDSDIYSFVVDQPGRILRLQVAGQFQSPGVQFDPYVAIYDNNWKLVARTDVGRVGPGTGNNFNIVIDNIYKTAGTYYAVVSHPINGTSEPDLLSVRSQGPSGLWNFTIGVSNPFPSRIPGDTYEDWNVQQLTSNRPGAREQTLSLLVQPGLNGNSIVSPDGGKVSLAAYVTGEGGVLEVGRVVIDEFPRTGPNLGGLVNLPIVIPEGLDVSGEFGLRVVVDPDAVSFETQAGIGGGPLTFDNAVSTPLPWDIDVSLQGVVSARPIIGTANSVIGDELGGLRDQDVFSRNLTSGVATTISLASSEFATALRVFDAQWLPVASAIASDVSNNVSVTFIPRRTGVHYFVVSGRGNASGDPRSLAVRTTSEAGGSYTLSFTGSLGDNVQNFISGTAFRDLNNDGIYGVGDTPLAGVSVWLDLDDDSIKDVDEPLEITNDQGLYLFDNLAVDPGSTRYTVRVQSLTGFSPRSASDAVRDVRLSRFGPDGAVTTDFGASDSINDSALQSDGKLVVVGNWDGGLSDFAIARYNPDGSLDTTFGGGFAQGTNSGRAHYAFGPGFGGVDVATSVAIQFDGKIVIAGYTNSINGVPAPGGYDFAILRLLPDGSLDNTFGVGGKVTLDLFGNDRANAVAIDSFGRIIVGGSTSLFDAGNFAIAVLQPNGAYDTSFGGGGIVVVNQPGRQVIEDLYIDDQRRIHFAGYSDATGADDFVIARYTPFGVLDGGFGSGGVVSYNFGWNDRAFAIKHHPQLDRLIVVGEADGGLPDFAILALRSNGSIDTTFGTNGARLVTFGNTPFGLNEGARDLVIDRTGGYFVVGYTTATTTGENGIAGQNNFAVAKLTNTGALDTSFDSDGRLVIDRGGDDEIFNTASGGGNDLRNLIHASGVSNANFSSRLLNVTETGPYASSNNNDFALRGIGSLDGFVSFDADDDGWDNNDPRLPNVGVFVDLNRDGILQADEPFTVTDADGYYNIGDLLETTGGLVELRFVVPETFVAIGGAVVDRAVLAGLTNRWVQAFADARHITTLTAALPDAMQINFVGGQLDELLASNLTLFNRTTGQTLTSSQLQLTPGDFASPSSARSLTLTFRNTLNPIGQNVLPNGEWLLTVSNFITGQTYRVPFDVFAGDANGNRRVDFGDLVILAQNYGQSGRTFSQGNFNYSPDGRVDFADLVILAQNYGLSLLSDSTPRPERSRRAALIEI